MPRLLLLVLTATLALSSSAFAQVPSNNPNDYAGTDSERIAAAVDAGVQYHNGTVVIPPRVPDKVADRDYWLLDSAILLPSDTTLTLKSCTLKLSDKCRDNFIRSANCGIGIEDIQLVHDIHIIGNGNALLVGADHPRASGDSVKPLGIPTCYYDEAQGNPLNWRSYGTDWDKEGERHNGDWRNIGILLAYVQRFSIQKLTIRDPHCWSISHEHCRDGLLRDLRFEATAFKMIDGKRECLMNQDGIDLRQGCHNFIIENITGYSGDDLIAMTAIAGGKDVPPGNLCSTMITGNRPTGDDDISHILIRNVLGHAVGRKDCQLVRFLNTGGTKIHDVIVDGVIDDSGPEDVVCVTVKVCDSLKRFGGVTPLGDTYGIILNNIHASTHSYRCIRIAGSLCDSIISNVINHNPANPPITYDSGLENTRNLTLTNLRQSN